MPDRADRKALYGIALRKVSAKAIQLMQEQEALENDAVKENRAGKCTHRYSHQYGLPCWHVLRQKNHGQRAS